MEQLPASSGHVADSEDKKELDISATEIQQQYYEAMGDADWEL